MNTKKIGALGMIVCILLYHSVAMIGAENNTNTQTDQNQEIFPEEQPPAQIQEESSPQEEINAVPPEEGTITENKTFLVPLDNVITETSNENGSLPQENSTKHSKKINISENKTFLVPLDNVITETSNETVSETNNSQPENKSLPSQTKNSAQGITTKEQSEESEKTKEEIPKPKETPKIYTAISKKNKIELEGTIPSDFDITSIEKTETTKNENVKEIVIKSAEHLAEPLTAYTDIPETPSEKKNEITLIWVNEEKEIPITGWYDTNNDGNLDRISWIVPHLSEQIFEVHIAMDEEVTTDEETITINDVAMPTGTQENPLTFAFNISYAHPQRVQCNLSVENTSTNILLTEITTTSGGAGPLDLPNGLYSWSLLCFDTENTTKNTTEMGTFTVDETFAIEGGGTFYVLDWENQLKNNPQTTFQLYSKGPTQTKTVTLLRDTTIVHTENTTDSTFNVAPYLSQGGAYTLKTTFYRLANPIERQVTFNVAKVGVEYSKAEIKINEDTQITVSIIAPPSIIASLIGIKFGDSSQDFQTNTNTKTFTHHYTNTGTYIITTDIQFPQTTTIYSFTKNGITVTSSADTTDPEISLIEPDDEDVATTDKITFAYKATDNQKLKNCTFDLYYYEDDSVIGTLNYSTTKTNPENGEEITITLKDFEEGEYTWSVGCYDNSSNYGEENRDLTVDFDTSITTLTQKTQEDEGVKKALNQLDDYNAIEQTLGLGGQTALEDLGITKNITYFKKRLAQINQDLTTNLNFITTDALREKRKKELIAEYETIREYIPLGVDIIETHEYAKNSITADIEAVLEKYPQEENEGLSKGALKKLADLTYEAQTNLKTQTTVTQLRITYPSKTQEITLVKKELAQTDDSYKIIFEIIPLEEKPTLITPLMKIDDEIYQTSPGDLENDKLLYYFEDQIPPKEIENTDTLLFKNVAVQESSITGLFALDFSSTNSFTISSIFLLLIILGYSAYILRKKMNLHKWKKEESVMRMLTLIEQIKEALKHNELGIAKEKYRELKEAYLQTPEGFKKYSYPEVQKIQRGIDRRDIIGLVKEYEKTKHQNTDEAKKIYQKVKETYKRLGKKDQERIYTKMFKSEWEI